MILAAAEGSLEDAADRLVRLVRAAVPEGSQSESSGRRRAGDGSGALDYLKAY